MQILQLGIARKKLNLRKIFYKRGNQCLNRNSFHSIRSIKWSGFSDRKNRFLN